MLTADDVPTIRFAILRRLKLEPSIDIVEDIRVSAHRDHIAVEVRVHLAGGLIRARSMFHLPLSFEIGHLHNEIDEIAEQYKVARNDTVGRTVLMVPEKQLSGTGLRGRWSSYG